MQVMNGEYNEMIERDLDYRANLGGRNPRARRERFDQPRSRWWEPQHRDWLSGALPEHRDQLTGALGLVERERGRHLHFPPARSCSSPPLALSSGGKTGSRKTLTQEA
ncbi:hypothetical protein GW17_00009955 [Ensete ventricosum]|nr:hypothetical protein GW17_00009955 [Ensete ventricosum]